MFKKRLITISALTFATALLLGSSLIISKKPEKVSAINDTHEHTGWSGVTDVTELPTTDGDHNIYLNDNITLSSTWTVPEGTTNLCLNGYVINANGGNFTAITISNGATLNLYDCGNTSHNGYVDSTGLWHLGEGEGTAKTLTGGIITGGNATTNGGGLNVSGTFNMYGGNIVGNKSDLGGGVYNTSTFTMYGGNICGNVALTQGGGVYCTTLSATILTGGNITENKATKGSGLFQKFEECFAVGTPITMADGTRKAIEDLTIGDEVRVFDHDEGTISSAKLFDLWSYPEKHSGVMNLHFTNSIDLTVVYGHSFFEREENKYVSVTRDTVSRYVGHEFYNVDNNRWETLTGYDFVKGEVDTYVITSEYHLNAVANGMLSNEDGFYTILTNIFDYGENLKIDQEKKAQDIQKYGLYSFENFKHMSKDTYDILGGQYLSVAFGKGLVTEEYFKSVEDYYSEVDPDLFCDDTNETNVIEKSIKREKRSLDPVNPPNKGLFVGGSIKILDNDVDNLLQESKGFVNIGSGTVGGGNGVIVPNEDMTIGISLVEGAGRFTTPGVEDYSSNFFSDSEKYIVRFNNKGNEDSSDDILELIKPINIINNVKVEDKNTNNGYIDVLSTAAEGDTVTLTVVPNPHYMLTENSLVVSYNDGEDKTADLAEGEDNEYTFTTPGYDVNISAAFEQKDEHVFSEIPIKLSTCTENGYKEAYHCSTCDQYFEDCLGEHRIGDLAAYEAWKLDGGKIPASHAANLVAGVEPTKERDGYKNAYKCSVCNEYFEDEACTKLIGDETAYNAWKANAGHLDKLAKEEPVKSNTGLIVGATCGGTFFLSLLVYTSCYFFLYRKGKLDARKIRAIYKFLPRGDKNLEK